MVERLFVTGTGTDVGKTVAATCLSVGLKRPYWKPVQTGEVRDIDFARGFTDVLPSAYSLRAPLSPHAAAALENVTISLEHVRPPAGPLVIEGAGGVLVPLNSRDLMIDLIARLEATPVVVASSRLGTINHTLLTLEALRARGLEPLGVILNGEENAGNARAIAGYGRTRVLGRIPPASAFSRAWFTEVFQSFSEVLHV